MGTPKVSFYPVGAVEDSRLLYAVIAARFQDKWVLVRNRDRDTWEVPAGHHEKGESIDRAAERELFEETGAVEYDMTPINVYSVNDGEKEAFGQLFFAQIGRLGELPDFEIAEVGLFDAFPDRLTYPLVQPYLLNRVKEFTGIQ